TADLPVPRTAVAGADIDAVELRVIRHGVPDRAAAAVLPPLARPGLRRLFHRGVFEALGRIAGHCPPAPHLFAGRRVIRGHITAHRAEVAAAEADDHLVVEHAGRTRYERAIVRIDGLHAPHGRAVLRIDRDQPAVVRANEQTTLPERQAADAP